LFESEQFFSGHPAGWGILATANHGQTVGLDLDAWFRGLDRISQPALQHLSHHVLELAPLLYGPQFHLAHEVGWKVESRFHAGSLLVFWHLSIFKSGGSFVVDEAEGGREIKAEMLKTETLK